MENDEQSIRHVVNSWLAATVAGDLEQILPLMAEDVVFLLPGHPPMRKQDFVQAQSAMKPFDIQIDSDIREIKILGDWAYCWNQLSLVVTPRDGGAPVKRAGHTLSIFQRQAGGWVLLRDANMLAAVQ